MKLLAFLWIVPFFALSFKEILTEGACGDYMVYDQKRTYTIIVLSDIDKNEITIEEISVPSHKCKETSWRAWLEQGAPESTGWMRYRINTDTMAVIESYSVSRKCWLPTESNDPLIVTLLRETLVPVNHDKRKRMAPKPGSVERTLWTPPFTADGSKQEVSAEAFTLYWPDDSSDIAGQALELYFTEKSPFPYWIELSSHNLRLRGIDSGKQLTLPGVQKSVKPIKIKKIETIHKRTLLEVENPSRLDAFSIHFTTIQEGIRETKNVTILSQTQEGERLKVEIDLPGQSGELTIIPTSQPHLAIDHQIH